MVTIRENGRERRVTAAEAFLLQLTQKGLAGDSAAARASLEAIATARSKRKSDHEPLRIVVSFVATGIETVLEPLGIATKKHATNKDRVRWQIQPWIVEASLARFGTSELNLEEQREVWTNTRVPETVRWPVWWSFKG